MFNINENYASLSGNYLFAEIGQKVAAFKKENPDADIIRLGIGDVTLPIANKVIKEMHSAVDEMGCAETFHGYGPEQGYRFLIQEIIKHDYLARGVSLDEDEVFISDGAKCDVGNIQELFSQNCTIAICDPVYPVYRDSNLMAGRGKNMIYLPCVADNGFSPELPEKADVIYLCSPNNPTGTVMSREQLTSFVEYAKKHQAIILFDSAYEAYIRDEKMIHSIYEIPGAKEVAIEIRSFSKTAGFTGIRCAYCVVPKELPCQLNHLWLRRQTTKFNGVSYIVQRGASAVYSSEGQMEVKESINYYMANAKMIREELQRLGMTVYGGEHAPYIWLKIPQQETSMKFFERLLTTCQVVGTPGIGFGEHGEGYFRLTAFGNRERTQEALIRIAQKL